MVSYSGKSSENVRTWVIDRDDSLEVRKAIRAQRALRATGLHVMIRRVVWRREEELCPRTLQHSEIRTWEGTLHRDERGRDQPGNKGCVFP